MGRVLDLILGYSLLLNGEGKSRTAFDVVSEDCLVCCSETLKISNLDLRTGESILRSGSRVRRWCPTSRRGATSIYSLPTSGSRSGFDPGPGRTPLCRAIANMGSRTVLPAVGFPVDCEVTVPG